MALRGTAVELARRAAVSVRWSPIFGHGSKYKIRLMYYNKQTQYDNLSSGPPSALLRAGS
jgi:hypothetical protein